MFHKQYREVGFTLILIFCVALGQRAPSSTCSLDQLDDLGGETTGEDPNLHVMEFDVGDGPQVTKVYIEPDISTFYQDKSTEKERKVSIFDGFQAKFCNLSKETVILWWQSKTSSQRHVMAYLAPWETVGLGVFSNQKFLFTPAMGDTRAVLREIAVTEAPHNIYSYDPYKLRDNPEPPSSWNQADKAMYIQWRKTLLFNKQYLKKTDRCYLANYLRAPPMHFMWPAEYFGQEHWVVTKETYFKEIPPSHKLARVTDFGKSRILGENDPRLLADYREDTNSLNMTLRVKSISPRLLEVPNFLSPAEVQHLLDLANKQGWERDVVSETFIAREDTPIIDAIYRRAADLKRVDEALMRGRDVDERPDVKVPFSLAEKLRLVRYRQDEDYAEHTDFSFERVTQPHQQARFSTLLIYLNEPEEGGETSFPKWVNAETGNSLKFKPVTGTALLFYSQLPDGNFDDLSTHGALPVLKGEKYVANLWLWDPLPLEQ